MRYFAYLDARFEYQNLTAEQAAARAEAFQQAVDTLLDSLDISVANLRVSIEASPNPCEYKVVDRCTGVGELERHNGRYICLACFAATRVHNLL